MGRKVVSRRIHEGAEDARRECNFLFEGVEDGPEVG
jgi:hypothetical protein